MARRRAEYEISTGPTAGPNSRPRPREDHGFFGPGSVTWRVWGYPTALTIGFQRAVVVEELDPFLLAAVAQLNGVRYDPRGRYDRTIHYFATIAFGDSRAAIEASEILMRVHATARGIEPISGLPFNANDPDSQLWILITGWHSVLHAYEKYGPGPLAPGDDRRYWADCAVAAEMQTCDPAKVPRSRDEVREYFARQRPRLCVSEDTRAIMGHLLDANLVMRTPYPALAPVTRAVARTVRTATIASMPRWMRELSGFDQPAAVNAAIIPAARTVMRAMASPPIALRTLDLISPSVRAVVEPAWRGDQPRHPVVVTPAEARTRWGREARAAAKTKVAGIGQGRHADPRNRMIEELDVAEPGLSGVRSRT